MPKHARTKASFFGRSAIAGCMSVTMATAFVAVPQFADPSSVLAHADTTIQPVSVDSTIIFGEKLNDTFGAIFSYPGDEAPYSYLNKSTGKSKVEFFSSTGDQLTASQAKVAVASQQTVKVQYTSEMQASLTTVSPQYTPNNSYNYQGLVIFDPKVNFSVDGLTVTNLVATPQIFGGTLNSTANLASEFDSSSSVISSVNKVLESSNSSFTLNPNSTYLQKVTTEVEGSDVDLYTYKPSVQQSHTILGGIVAQLPYLKDFSQRFYVKFDVTASATVSTLEQFAKYESGVTASVGANYAASSSYIGTPMTQSLNYANSGLTKYKVTYGEFDATVVPDESKSLNDFITTMKNSALYDYAIYYYNAELNDQAEVSQEGEAFDKLLDEYQNSVKNSTLPAGQNSWSDYTDEVYRQIVSRLQKMKDDLHFNWMFSAFGGAAESAVSFVTDPFSDLADASASASNIETLSNQYSEAAARFDTLNADSDTLKEFVGQVEAWEKLDDNLKKLWKASDPAQYAEFEKAYEYLETILKINRAVKDWGQVGNHASSTDISKKISDYNETLTTAIQTAQKSDSVDEFYRNWVKNTFTDENNSGNKLAYPGLREYYNSLYTAGDGAGKAYGIVAKFEEDEKGIYTTALKVIKGVPSGEADEVYPDSKNFTSDESGVRTKLVDAVNASKSSLEGLSNGGSEDLDSYSATSLETVASTYTNAKNAYADAVAARKNSIQSLLNKAASEDDTDKLLDSALQQDYKSALDKINKDKDKSDIALSKLADDIAAFNTAYNNAWVAVRDKLKVLVNPLSRELANRAEYSDDDKKAYSDSYKVASNYMSNNDDTGDLKIAVQVYNHLTDALAALKKTATSSLNSKLTEYKDVKNSEAYKGASSDAKQKYDTAYNKATELQGVLQNASNTESLANIWTAHDELVTAYNARSSSQSEELKKQLERLYNEQSTRVSSDDYKYSTKAAQEEFNKQLTNAKALLDKWDSPTQSNPSADDLQKAINDLTAAAKNIRDSRPKEAFEKLKQLVNEKTGTQTSSVYKNSEAEVKAGFDTAFSDAQSIVTAQSGEQYPDASVSNSAYDALMDSFNALRDATLDNARNALIQYINDHYGRDKGIPAASADQFILQAKSAESLQELTTIRTNVENTITYTSAAVNLLKSLNSVEASSAYVNASTQRIENYAAAKKSLEDSVADTSIASSLNISVNTELLNMHIKALDGVERYDAALKALEQEIRQYSNVVYSSRYQNDTQARRQAYRDAYSGAKTLYDSVIDKTSTTNVAEMENLRGTLAAARLNLQGASDLDAAKSRLQTAILVNSLTNSNLNDKQKAAFEAALEAVKNDGDLRALEDTVITIAREQNLLRNDVESTTTVQSSSRYQYASDAAKQAYEQAVQDGSTLLQEKSDVDGWADVSEARNNISSKFQDLNGVSPYAGRLQDLIDQTYDTGESLKFTGAAADKRTAYLIAIAKGRFVLADPSSTDADYEAACQAIETSMKALDGDLPRKIVLIGAGGSALIVLLGYILSLVLKKDNNQEG
ncbi:MAG: hypothetical protein Q3976_10230 [Corynebacterium sp.]|nr:hypothetical protein [Corynebacterium sp.]